MSQVNDIEKLAKRAMRDRGLEPDFPVEVLREVDRIDRPASPLSQASDLRHFKWCSIDNDDSRDLDQLTYAEIDKKGNKVLWVAIADVDGLVPKFSPTDQHAEVNTTSVYIPGKMFPMLPEKLSTNLTSLNPNVERSAIVVQMIVDAQSQQLSSSIFPAIVYNYAQLTYNEIGMWLADSNGQYAPPSELIPSLQIQHQASQLMKAKRFEMGALTLETNEPLPLLHNDRVVGLEAAQRNLAHELIENFMIAANSTIARFMESKRIPSLRRVVKTPRNWPRIVEVAALHGEKLPATPDSKALNAFLVRMKESSPGTFCDLSLVIIKLLGSGEYVVSRPGNKPEGHFGLSIMEYTHATAPNRRYPDIITQRQLKAELTGKKNPYGTGELEQLASHCTMQADAASKVERKMRKTVSAMVLQDRIGDLFEGIVTGVSDRGTWARISDPLVEGMIVDQFLGLQVGDRVTLKLVSLDIPRGFIDFAAVKRR